MSTKFLKEVQDVLSTIYNGNPPEMNDIVYEHGHPLNYKEDFLKLWLIHMEYINSVQNFSLPNVNQSIFNESLNRFIQNHKEVKLFLAKKNTKAIGFLQAGIAPNKTYGFISDLHVLEQYRRLGIGKNLLKDCLDWFSENRIKEIGLEVTGGNEEALNFYRRNGFNIDQYSLKMKKE